MNDYLSNIDYANYLFDENVFNLILDLYNNPKRIFKDNKTINKYSADNGLGGFIFKLLNTEIDSKTKDELRKRNDYLNKLIKY
ncbi:MAG: hypothetical protein IJH34_03605, partial [Romboutsia sp.]|nr:hypothetical protein [Romboutsia sp.]